ncbi:MAG: Small GTP-binding domain protein [Promethearchaeota archaeon]|nr:MAG: Small GTP-binding domain protein [Candidatus Lokiarchaeota archaeon]
MENTLNILLENYLNDVDKLRAVAICDRDGLIMASKGTKEAEKSSDSVIGAISAVLENYIDRIKKEFGTTETFFNITSTGDKKFAYCSKGPNSILTTIAEQDASDTEIKVYSEHIANKVELILKGKENVSLKVPAIIKALAKSRSGELPRGEYSGKIILTGDYSVGKTSLVRRFVENKFKDNYLPTIGVDITKKEVELDEETKVNFILWDIGGQRQQMQPYRKRFYQGANAALIVVDRTREKTLESVETWYNDIKESVSMKIPIVITGNKSDLKDEIVISEQDIRKKADEHGFHYIITSAKTGENVSDAFLYLAYRLVERAA